MIFGHLGLALGARAVDPELPLPWLVVVAVLPDLLDVGVAAAGICNPDGAFTHGLPAIAGIAVVVATVEAVRSHRVRAVALVVALLLSHVGADYLTGLKALWVGGPVIGLNLYQWAWADFALEAIALVGGWWAARRWGRVPRWVASQWALVALLVAQLLADVLPQRGVAPPTRECAKAAMVRGIRRLL